MRVVFFLGGLTAGGAEKTVHALAHRRLRQGDQVCIAAFAGTKQSAYLCYDPAIVLRFKDPDGSVKKGGIVKLLTRAGFVRKICKEFRADLVVSFLTKTNIAVLLGTPGLGIPVVISERNNPLRQENAFAVPFFLKVMYPLAERIVMQSGEARKILSASVRAKTVVIPNAVARNRTKRTFFQGRNQEIVAVGRLTAQKGFDLLIDAFAKAASKAPNASLVIYGEGQDQEKLQAQIERLGLGGRVVLAGLSDTPLSWTARGNIFVLSSRFATDCEWGPASILRDGIDGLLVRPEDADALAGALERLLSDASLCQQLGDEARRASDRFSEERVYADWDNVFESVLKER
jgi:glycosyltransferase involved in cell wall biosynthesis